MEQCVKEGLLCSLQSRILQLKLHMHVQKMSPRSCMEEKRPLRPRFRPRPSISRGCEAALEGVPTCLGQAKCNILYYSVLFHIILYYSVLFCIILYYSILFCIILYYSVLFCIILYYSVLFRIILYYSVLFCIIPYYSVLLCCEAALEGVPTSLESPQKMFWTKQATFLKIFIFTPQNCFLRIFSPTAK